MGISSFLIKTLGSIIYYKDNYLIGWSYPSILLPIDVVINLFDLLKERLGNKEYKKIINKMTNIQSETLTSWWKRFNIPKKLVVNIGKDNLESQGMGKIEYGIIKGNSMTLKIRSNIAKHYLKKHGLSKEPVCLYIQSELNNSRKIYQFDKVEEVKCIGKGDDICVFKSKKR